jgi:hypothetical protein
MLMSGFSAVKLTCKWVFVFAILSLWTFAVLSSTVSSLSFGASPGVNIDIQQEITPDHVISEITAPSQVPVNTPLYFESADGKYEKASSFGVLSYLFRNDFSIEQRVDYVKDSYCSVRAEQGREKVSFYVGLPQATKSTGTYTSQNPRESYSFMVYGIVMSSPDVLKLNILSESGDDGVLTFNKNSKKIQIMFENNSEMSVQNLDVTFTRGCNQQERLFYVIKDNGQLEGRRSIEQVRGLLRQYPMIEDNFESLRRLDQEYWMLVLPDGFVS